MKIMKSEKLDRKHLLKSIKMHLGKVLLPYRIYTKLLFFLYHFRWVFYIGTADVSDQMIPGNGSLTCGLWNVQ